MAVILTEKELAEMMHVYDDKKEFFLEARSRRKAFKSSFGPEFDAATAFKNSLWQQFFPKHAERSLEGFSLDSLRMAVDTGYYQKLDQLNSELAPKLKEYRLLRAVESAAETEANKAERDWEYEVKRRKKHLEKQTAKAKSKNPSQIKLVL